MSTPSCLAKTKLCVVKLLMTIGFGLVYQLTPTIMMYSNSWTYKARINQWSLILSSTSQGLEPSPIDLKISERMQKNLAEVSAQLNNFKADSFIYQTI